MSNFNSHPPPSLHLHPTSPIPSQLARPSAKMKLSIHQLVSTYLVLQATALPTEIDPIDIDLENMEPVTIDPMNLGATTVSVVDHHAPSTILVAPVAEATQSATAVETPAAGETLTIPDIDIPLGNPYAGKPAWECWYEKNLARNTYHMTAINWNATESDIHDTCKKSDALTFWNWEEHINSAGAQTILVGVRFVGGKGKKKKKKKDCTPFSILFLLLF